MSPGTRGPDWHRGSYYAVSEDGGRHFSKPLALLTDAWVPYADVQLALDGRGNAWVAFEDRRDGRPGGTAGPHRYKRRGVAISILAGHFARPRPP